MRKMKRLAVMFLVLSMLFVMTGCGVKGYRANQSFKMGNFTYCFEDAVHVPEKDTDTSRAYAVSILVKEGFPINWDMNTGNLTVAVKLSLNGKDDTIEYSELNAESFEEERSGFKNRMTFIFQIPNDSKLPKQATFSVTKGSSESVDINISSAPGWDG